MHTYSQEFVTRQRESVLAGTRRFGLCMPVRIKREFLSHWTSNPDLR
jgi:hypothetical protein